MFSDLQAGFVSIDPVVGSIGPKRGLVPSSRPGVGQNSERIRRKLCRGCRDRCPRESVYRGQHYFTGSAGCSCSAASPRRVTRNPDQCQLRDLAEAVCARSGER